VRRGPAPEARRLYEDLKPPQTSQAMPADAGRRPPGAGRPTKRERRRIDQMRRPDG
jgi:ribosome-associated heat shock protein Hsp15